MSFCLLWASFSCQAFKESAENPLRLTVAGWGDTRWTPATHPHMVMGMSQKGIKLQQTTNIMNLRPTQGLRASKHERMKRYRLYNVRLYISYIDQVLVHRVS